MCMQRKAITAGIVTFLLLSTGFVNLSAEENSPIYETNWWDVYSRDKNNDGISDLLVWKLEPSGVLRDGIERFISLVIAI